MVAAAIAAARAAARRAQESLYDGCAVVSEYQSIKDPETGITRQQEVVVFEDLPCRLSYATVTEVSQTEGAAVTAQAVKLFCSPEIGIKAGSKIAVTQAGKEQVYQCSGVPAVYFTHQEIPLSLFERWA